MADTIFSLLGEVLGKSSLLNFFFGVVWKVAGKPLLRIISIHTKSYITKKRLIKEELYCQVVFLTAKLCPESQTSVSIRKCSKLQSRALTALILTGSYWPSFHAHFVGPFWVCLQYAVFSPTSQRECKLKTIMKTRQFSALCRILYPCLYHPHLIFIYQAPRETLIFNI